MRIPGLVLGYHGCDRDVAETVLAGSSDVRSSENSYDWLGSGAYFWENNPARALAWARLLAKRDTHARKRIKEPAVIGAILNPGECLDLTEQTSLDMVREAFSALEEIHHAIGIPLPENEKGFEGDQDLIKRHLDCAVVNFLHELRAAKNLPSIDTIRAPFIEGDELFKGSKLRTKTHVQWCIRNPKHSIIAYFRPRDPKATEV